MVFTIRNAKKGEEDVIFALLYELADYEKLLGKFDITKNIITRDYFSEEPLCRCDLAFEGDAPVGIATWYWIYNSFAAIRSIYLEDLFVRPAFRGKGYGKALLVHLAKTAREAGAGGVQWSVLDWNKPSIEFYESLGARRIDGWHSYRLEGDALKKAADV